MARLDVRVKTEVPARILGRPSSEAPGGAVTLRELSLGGALLQGLQESVADGRRLRIRADLASHGEVNLQGRVVREKDGLAALKFFAADEPSVCALWEHIRQRLRLRDVCPYCGRVLGDFDGFCRHCRMCLDFSDQAYLERHLKNTFAARIASLVDDLSAGQLQDLVAVIEQQVERSRSLGPPAELVGRSPAMLRVLALVEQYARCDTNVLILGEKGCERETVARSLHQKSRRRLSPFVPVSVSSIPAEFLDPELFGFNRGAFRSAERARKGLLEAADGGALFIDDIGALPPGLQAKLLGFLKDGIVERLGSRGGKRVDVRILAGADEEFIRAGDSECYVAEWLRLMTSEPVHLPPLRQRGEDCILLAEHYLQSYAREAGSQIVGFSDDALEMIRTDCWPGNAAELSSSVKRGVSKARGKVVKKVDMQAVADLPPSEASLKAAVSVSEKEAVERALEENRYNISRAAKTLKISRPSLYVLMRKHDLQKPQQ